MLLFKKQLLFTCTLCRRVIEHVNVHVHLKWPPKLHDNGVCTFLSGYIGSNTNMGCHTEVTISPDSQSIPELSSVLHVVILSSWCVTVSEDLISLNVLLLCAARSPMYAQMFTIVVFPCWPATVIHVHTHYKTGFNLLRGWRGSPPPQAMKPKPKPKPTHPLPPKYMSNLQIKIAESDSSCLPINTDKQIW